MMHAYLAKAQPSFARTSAKEDASLAEMRKLFLTDVAAAGQGITPLQRTNPPERSHLVRLVQAMGFVFSLITARCTPWKATGVRRGTSCCYTSVPTVMTVLLSAGASQSLLPGKMRQASSLIFQSIPLILE